MSLFLHLNFIWLPVKEAHTLQRHTFIKSAWRMPAAQSLKIPVPFSSFAHFTRHSKCLHHIGLGKSLKLQISGLLFLWAPLIFLSFAIPRKKALKQQKQNKKNPCDWKGKILSEKKISQSKKALLQGNQPLNCGFKGGMLLLSTTSWIRALWFFSVCCSKSQATEIQALNVFSAGACLQDLWR